MRMLLRRLFHAFIVVFGVLTVVFFLTRVVADPARLQLAAEATQEDYEAVKSDLGLDGSLVHQYGAYLGDVAHFDFGESFTQSRPATTVVREALPKTLQLVAIALPLTVVLSLGLGISAARRPGKAADRIVSSLSLIGLSIPAFLVGLVLMLIFGVWLKWLPTSGPGGLDHLILPVLTLTLASTGRLTMMIRSSMIDELNRPWIDVARAKGMPSRRIVGVHALRNASVAILTLVGWELITMLAGYAIIVEFVFAWPGIGLAALKASAAQDLPVVQMIVLLIAITVVVVNILIDIGYTFIDPRIKLR
jgi:peptide/nickel transport system permease protein